jgi:hypothetical protein
MAKEMLATCLMLAAAELPPWSVGTDGTSCVLIDDALAAMLERWHEDPSSSSPEDGIWVRYDPAAPRRAVLLFDTERTCRAAVGGPIEKSVPKRLTTQDVRRELAALVRDDRHRAAIWRALSAKERKSLSLELEKAFAGEAARRRVEETLDLLHRRARSSPAARRRVRLRLDAYEHLFRVAFGVRYRPPRPPRQPR